MEVITKFPLTKLELAELAEGQHFVRFPASLDEYWELLAEAEYRVDYYDHEIIATMRYETDLHSHFAAEMGGILRQIFADKKRFRLYNSNRPVHIENCSGSETGVFNPDGMVVALPSAKYEYRPGMDAETAPVFVLEVLSPSTRHYDWGTKLPCYQQIPTLRQIVFMESDRPHLVVFERESPNRWTETVLTDADDSFHVEGQPVSLRAIYGDVYL